MASKEFVAVTWSPGQMIDQDTLDQINNNLTFLRDQSVDGSYMHLNNGVTSAGVKILAGRKLVPPVKSDTTSARIGFAKMFTPDSVPIVVCTILAADHSVKFSHTISGIGRDHPNHQGFQVKINRHAESEKKDVIDKALYVNWIAMGY